MDFRRLIELWSLNRRLIITFGLLGFAFVFLYLVTFEWLLDQWLNDRVYSHGFIVPMISLYIVWINRERLAVLKPRPGYLWGGLLLLISMPLLLVGRVGAVVQAETLSFFLALPGVILFVWGWSHLRALALPLLYLQFMVPWMDLFMERLQWIFQLISAEIGSFLLSALGYSVFHDSIYIQLPGITMVVARECSGINFLISVLAIALPWVYLSQNTWRRAVVVLVSGCVITVLANGVRVALAGIMGSNYGLEMLHGPGHIFRGWFVAQVGWIGVFLVNWAVLRFRSGSGSRLYEKWKKSDIVKNDVSLQTGLTRPIIIVMVFLFGFGIYMHGFALPRPIPLKQSFATFPYRIGDWKGRDSDWLKSEEFFPGADAELTRTYRNPSGQEVYLYVGYFESQSFDKRLISFHDHDLYKKAMVISTNLDHPGPGTVNRSSPTIEKRPYEALFWYWFPSGDLAGRRDAKFKTISDALLHRRNNGAVIILAVPLRNPGSRDQAASISGNLVSFLGFAAPHLRNYLP